MTIIMAIIEVTPGHEVEWQQISDQTQQEQRQQPGFRAARWFKDVTEPDRFVFMSEWDEDADHDAMVRNLGILWLDRGLHFLKGAVKILHLEETSFDPETAAATRTRTAEHENQRRGQ